ncbi:MAG: hypothetical protein C0169_00440, partial [Thermodesulfobacterium geofontis]
LNFLSIVILLLYFKKTIFQKILFFSMKIFTYILFLIALFLPNYSLGTPLLLKIDLEFYPKFNLLKGSLFAEFSYNEEYKFITSDLTINEVETSSEVFLSEDGSLNILAKNRSTLYISFEKNINPYLLPITIVSSPFPYPDKPFIYQINFKIPSNFENMEILIPSEELEIKRNKDFLIYTFKIQKPILTPCLFISTLKPEKIKFSYKRLDFYFYYFPQFYNLSEKDLKRFFENFKTLGYYLENVGGPLYPFNKLYIILLPEDFPKTKNFSNVLFINPSSLEDVKQFVHALAKKKLEDGLFWKDEEIKVGLITYLIDYQLAENQKTFRKLQLSFPKKESKAFFYFLFLTERIGEKNFIDILKNFYKNNIFSFKNWNDFLNSAQKNYPEFKNFLISYEEFQKLNLRGEIKSINREKDNYLINFTLYTNLDSENLMKSIFIPIKIETEEENKFLILNLKNKIEDFQISVKGIPKVIYIDPEYKLWRDLDFDEIPNCIAKLFHSQGTLIVNKDNFPTYKNLVDYFRNLGYKISFSPIDFSEISKISENLIYLDISPLPWQFNSSFQGFYLKVIPNPYNSQYVIGYLHIPSKNNYDWIIKNLASFSLYSEIFIQSKKIVFKREDETSDGIPVFIPSIFEENCIKGNFSFRKEILKFVNSQIILVGVEKENLLCKDYFKNFLQSFYNFNINIVLALDLPSSFQKVFEDYFENKISESQLKENLKDLDLLNFEEILEIINWAKINKIKVLTVGAESEIFSKILAKGLEGLSQREISKLPEIDLLNPSYKEYLYSLFIISENLQKFNFENFYQAQIFKLEDLAE